MDRSTNEFDQRLDQITLALRIEPVPPFLDPIDSSRPAATQVNLAPPPAVGKPSASLDRNRSRVIRSVSVVFAGAAALCLFFVFTSINEPKFAFSQVQAALAKTKSVRCRFLDFHGDKDPLITTTVSLEGVGSRAEQPNGRESITNLKQRRNLSIDHRERKVEVRELYLEEGDSLNGGEFFERLREVAHGGSQEIEPITEKGKKILRFKFEHLGENIAFVDAVTKLPIRIELTMEKGLSRDDKFREVITDFIFDSHVDESLFSVEVPPGYEVSRYEEPKDRARIDTSTLVVSQEKGMSSVLIGAKREQVIAAFGAPDGVRKTLDGGPRASPNARPNDPTDRSYFEKLSYPSLGFEITFSSRMGVTEIQCYGRGRLGPYARNFRGKTDKEIRLGASVEEVLKAYGKPDFRRKLRDDGLSYMHLGWDFQFMEGKLVSFSMRKPTPPEIEIIDRGDGTFTETVKKKN